MVLRVGDYCIKVGLVIDVRSIFLFIFRLNYGENVDLSIVCS